MAVESLSNMMLHKSLMNDINAAKKSVATAQKQISSGRAIDSYLELSSTGRVEGAINLESRIADYTSYIRNNDVISARIEATDIALKTIMDNLYEYRAVAVKRRSAVGSLEEIRKTIGDLGKSVLGVIRDNLNTRYEGQFLFSGARIEQEPVADIVNNSNYLNGEYTSNYYLGDDITRSARVNDSLVVEYGVKANHESFQKAIAAIHILIETDNDQDAALAYDMLDESLGEMINLRANVKNAATQVAASSDIQRMTKLYFEETLSELTATKIEEVSVRLANDMTILMGTYQAFAHVSRLNLADYLK